MNKISFLFVPFLLVSCLSDQLVTTEAITTEADYSIPNDLADEYHMLSQNIRRNNALIEHATEALIAQAEETVKTKTMYQALIDPMKQPKALTSEFKLYIKDLRTNLIAEAGGTYTDEEAYQQGYPDLAGKLKNPESTNAVNAIFLLGEGEYKETEARILDEKISNLRNEYIQLVANLWDNGGIKGTIFADPSKKDAALNVLHQEMVLSNSQNYDPTKHDGKSWATYTFGNKSAMRVNILLYKFLNDAILSEAAVINFLAGQMGKLELIYDMFDVFAQSPKPYIRLGETYEAEIALGAYSSQAKFTVYVDGQSLIIRDGKALYRAKGNSVGEKTYRAKISVQNPLTGETESFTKEFRYEVGK